MRLAGPSSPRAAVDWAALRARLAASVAAAHDDGALRERVLRARARAAAREAAPAHDGPAPLQVVEFVLALERYAIEVGCVREVVPLRELTPLPGAPAFVAGLVSVRGRIVSVLDLKAFFDLPAKGLPDLNRLIVMDSAVLSFGLLVDAVSGIGTVRPDRLQPPPPTFSGPRAHYLRGLTPDRLAVLDGTRLLSDPQIVVRQTPLGGPASDPQMP